MKNPLIEFIPSSTASGYPVSNILDYSNEKTHWASGENQGLNANLTVNLGVPFCITHYSIRSHDSTNLFMKAWTLEGSNDKIYNYKILDNKETNDDLMNN